MARRLGRPDLFAGAISTEQRFHCARGAIRDGKFAGAIAYKRKGYPAETWEQLFQRLYGEAL